MGGRGPGIGIPVRGGGLLGLLVVLAIVVLPQMLDGGTVADQRFNDPSNQPFSNAGNAGDAGDGFVQCETELEQIVCGAVDDVSEYWEVQYPQTFQGRFPGTETVFFSGVVDTGCGQAPAEVGPFYCPADQLVYFDLSFLEQLQREFGAGGDLAAQYIVAHEYGHHVQNVTGISDRARSAGPPGNEASVALELQADCFAGAWASSLRERDLFSKPGEIAEALVAAEAVGDDRIQERAGRSVNPENFTHGTAEQRRSWFERGFRTGDPASCATFGGSLAP